MAHKIRVSFLGEGEILPAIVDAVLNNCVIPPENIFLSDKDTAVKEQNLKQNVVFCPDDMDVVVKGEIVVVTAPKKLELASALAPISGCTRGRIVIAICPDITCDYVLERVSGGTTVLAVKPVLDDSKKLVATLEFSEQFPPYMRTPCMDIVASLFEIL